METLPWAMEFRRLAEACRAPSLTSTEGARGSGSSGRSTLTDLGKAGGPDGPPSVSSPPLAAPARETAAGTKNPRDLLVNPKVHLAQSKRFAKGALDHYNKRKKIKYELLDVVPVNSMPESCRCYTHINFTARSTKKGSQEQLFFAELYHCGRGPSGFCVTCCEPLGRDFTVGSRCLKHDGTSVVRKNVDFSRCFACNQTILHPKGEKYIAGHLNIPRIYSSPC